MSLGISITLIVLLGYLSNWINGRFFANKAFRLLYYLGALVHESSHALLCLVTGAKIIEFEAFSAAPHVTHTKSRLPIIGGLLISAAPIFGGLLFLYLVKFFVLGDYFALLSPHESWQSILLTPITFLLQLNLLNWKSWIFILLLLNSGAMLGPSLQDIKNIWLAYIILFFVFIPEISSLCLLATTLIIANIIIQSSILVLITMGKKICSFIARREA
jgi:hypothetical protein